MKSYTYDDVRATSVGYFNGDELAADVFAGKYALQDLKGNIYEKSPVDMHHRLAKEFARIENKYENPMSEGEIFDLFKDWTVVPQGSPMSAVGNPFQVQSLSNCFVIESPYDSYGGILRTDQEQVQIMKRRGGVGFDLSTIRPRGLEAANAARTTDGIGVFMERYSNTCREVAQGGRRGALMLTISVHHPEVLTFINIKRDKLKITGANVSVKVTDEFMNAVKDGKKYVQRFPLDTSKPAIIEREVDAQEVWKNIVSATRDCSEPGLLFWDTVKRRSPADAYASQGFETVSTNPCVVGDTLIATADGRNAVSIKQLVEEGKDVPVYSTNVVTGQVEIKWGRNPRLTKSKVEVWKLILDDGSTFVATPDHNILLRNLTYVKLSELKSGDSIFPFSSFDSNGYRQVCNTGVPMSGGKRRNKRQYFVNQVSNNHKVVSVERAGFEDVYNITVDDNHNYHVITSNNDSKYVVSSGICVKNCGEITLSAYDSCRLLLINLSKFVKNPFTTNATFDFDSYAQVVQKSQRLMDDLIDLEIEAIDKIIKKIKHDPEPDDVKDVEVKLWKKIRDVAISGRRTGLGITALGDTFAYLGMKYGSVESIELTGEIYKNLAFNSYRSSVELAKERGAFPAFSFEIEKDHPFIKQVVDLDNELKSMYEKYGRRNIANTTTAPAGSVSLLTQTTSGCEPVIFIKSTRKKKINPSDKQARVDEIDKSGDSWQHYDVFHPGVKMWMNLTGRTNVLESPYAGSTVEEIDWMKKIDIQAAAQKWVCHAISNTTNLPNDVTTETVEKLCMHAWVTGCKGATIYRIGSRDAVIVKETTVDGQPFEVTETQAPKRPKDLECDINRVSVKGENYLVLVGLLNNKPYEVFAGLSQHVEVPKKFKKGTLIKNGKKDGIATYNLRIPFDDDELLFKDVVNLFDNPEHGALTRMISLSMRHGVPVQFLTEQLKKDKHSDLQSFSNVVARVLKSYIIDGTNATSTEKKCPDCGGETLIYQQGCVSCIGGVMHDGTSCSWSKC